MEDITPKPSLDRYELLEVIRQGGANTATVYKARHQFLNTIVALKVINLEQAEKDVVERFGLEIQTLGRLRTARHPNIVDVYDAGISENQGFLAMEYVQGSDLGSLIRPQEGQLPPPGLAMRVCRDTARALTVLHHHQLVHRDVKPKNLLITDDLETKLIDLGIVKDLSGTHDISRRHLVEALGTEPFMAPEQLSPVLPGDPFPFKIGPYTDLYGLGKTLYFALTGKDGTIRGLGNNARWQGYANFVPENPTESGAYADCYPLLRRMLTQDPAQRISSAREVQEGLETLMPPYEGSTTSSFDFPTILASSIAHQPPKLILGPNLMMIRPDVYSQITGEEIRGGTTCDPSLPRAILPKNFPKSSYRAGRHHDMDFVLSPLTISRHHVDIQLLFVQDQDSYVHLKCTRPHGITLNGISATSIDGKTGDVIGFSPGVAYVLSSARHLHNGSRSYLQKHPELRADLAAHLDTIKHIH